MFNLIWLLFVGWNERVERPAKQNCAATLCCSDVVYFAIDCSHTTPGPKGSDHVVPVTVQLAKRPAFQRWLILKKNNITHRGQMANTLVCRGVDSIPTASQQSS